MGMRVMRPGVTLSLVGAVLSAPPIMARELGLDERIRAQEAIDLVAAA